MFSRRTSRGPSTGRFHTEVCTSWPCQEMSCGRPTLTDSRLPTGRPITSTWATLALVGSVRQGPWGAPEGRPTGEGGGQAGQAERSKEQPEVAQRDIAVPAEAQQVHDDPEQPGGDQVAAKPWGQEY